MLTIMSQDFVMEAIPYNPYNGGRSVRHWQAPSASVGRNPRFTPPPGYMSPGADPDSPPFSAGNPQAIDLRKIYWNHDMRTTVSLSPAPFFEGKHISWASSWAGYATQHSIHHDLGMAPSFSVSGMTINEFSGGTERYSGCD